MIDVEPQPGSPTVTAVIRTYNRADMLGKAIESILNQTYDNFELLILDDCSSDGTEKLVKQYCLIDDRIRYHRQKQNIGNVCALNMSTQMALGKYIACLDDDDEWLPRKLELQVDKFENGPPNLGLVTGGIHYINIDIGKTVKIWKPSLKGEIYFQTLGKSGDIFGPPSVVMIKKNVLEDVGSYREDMPRGACQQMYRRIAKKYLIDYVEDIVLDYHYHTNAITAITGADDLQKHIKSTKIKIESTKDDLIKVPQTYADELTKLGYALICNMEFIEGYRHVAKASHIDGASAALRVIKALMAMLKYQVNLIRHKS